LGENIQIEFEKVVQLNMS
jgi:hypothetical protein